MNIVLPKSWNELTTVQRIKLASLFHEGAPELLFDYKVFSILMSYNSWIGIFKFRKISKVLKQVRLQDLKKHYSWVYNEVGLTNFPRCIRGNKKLKAPKDRLTNLTIEEFAVADDLYLGWYRTKDREYLEYLAALLYWDVKKRKRTSFDKMELEDRAKLFKEVSIGYLLLIGMTYQGCKTHITNQFPLVFPKSNKALDNSTVRVPQSSGFGKLILQLSGQKFGTYKETKRTDIYTFLSEVTEQIKANNKLNK